MTAANQQTFSDETIRRFLLGGLSATAQSGFEHSLFIDEALEERVRLAELELSDDYTANRLSHAERNLFRQRFLLTRDRETELHISKALHKKFAGPTSIARSGAWQNLTGLLDIRRHAWKYAFATLTFILLLLATALLVRKERSHLVNLPPRRVLPKPSASANPQRANHPPNSGAPTHNESSPTLPLHEGLTTSIVLDSATPPESAPTISTSGDVLTIQLVLDEPFAESYAVNVTNAAGESVFAADALTRSEERTLGFDVPTSSIQPGNFQIALTAVDGEVKRAAGTYYLRVR